MWFNVMSYNTSMISTDRYKNNSKQYIATAAVEGIQIKQNNRNT